MLKKKRMKLASQENKKLNKRINLITKAEKEGNENIIGAFSIVPMRHFFFFFADLIITHRKPIVSILIKRKVKSKRGDLHSLTSKEKKLREIFPFH